MENRGPILVIVSVLTALSIAFGQGSLPRMRETRAVPRVWDDKALTELEVPLADPNHSPVHVSSDYYYKLPVRPVYKSYPVYPPGKEPPNYIEWLQQQDPEIVFNPAELQTESDWIRAGELVFDAPIRFAAFSDRTIRNPELVWSRKSCVQNSQNLITRLSGAFSVKPADKPRPERNVCQQAQHKKENDYLEPS